MKTLPHLVILAALACVFSGCATYVTPGAKADLQIFASPDIQAAMDAKPTNPFPANIAVVRVQSPTYSNYRIQREGGSYGSGRYSIILSREAGEESALARLAALPQVAGVVGLNRMLLQSELKSDREIREAAARLHADLVLLYTFDTTFRDRDAATPLSVITLGLSPTRRITASTTASALLLDTRTGYVYSAYEVTERQAATSTSWGSAESADTVRRDTEQRALARLMDEFAAAWPKLSAARP